jgi:hypothetical protein
MPQIAYDVIGYLVLMVVVGGILAGLGLARESVNLT